MNNILPTYRCLSPSSSRSDVSDVLTSIINGIISIIFCPLDSEATHLAPPLTFDKVSRTELIKLIIHDLQNHGSKNRLTTKGIFDSPSDSSVVLILDRCGEGSVGREDTCQRSGGILMFSYER